MRRSSSLRCRKDRNLPLVSNTHRRPIVTFIVYLHLSILWYISNFLCVFCRMIPFLGHHDVNILWKWLRGGGLLEVPGHIYLWRRYVTTHFPLREGDNIYPFLEYTISTVYNIQRVLLLHTSYNFITLFCYIEPVILYIYINRNLHRIECHHHIHCSVWSWPPFVRYHHSCYNYVSYPLCYCWVSPWVTFY